MIVKNIYSGQTISIRRLARTFREPVSTVGRWVGPERKKVAKQRCCPVSGDRLLRARVRDLCDQPRKGTKEIRRRERRERKCT